MSDTPAPRVDLQQAQQLLEKLESDLARARATGNLEDVRREVDELRAALADADPSHAAHPELSAGLSGLRQRLHELGDELFDDALTASSYVAWVGRILGL